MTRVSPMSTGDFQKLLLSTWYSQIPRQQEVDGGDPRVPHIWDGLTHPPVSQGQPMTRADPGPLGQVKTMWQEGRERSACSADPHQPPTPRSHSPFCVLLIR